MPEEIYDGKWGYRHLGSKENSIYYTIGLFKWIREISGEYIEGKPSKYVIGFCSNIAKIVKKAEEACEKLNKGVVNRRICIYADPKAKNKVRGDVPIGQQNLVFPSHDYYNFNSLKVREPKEDLHAVSHQDF